MRELKDLVQEELEQGKTYRQIAEKAGINFNTFYTFAKARYGYKINPVNATKLIQHFGQGFMVNGEAITGLTKEGLDPEATKKLIQVMDILDTEERTVIPTVFAEGKDKLIRILENYGIKAKIVKFGDSEYIERIREAVDKRTFEKTEKEEMDASKKTAIFDSFTAGCIEGTVTIQEAVSMTQKVHDPVNHPSHYKQGAKETIDVIFDLLTPDQQAGYLTGNIIKYISRYKAKNGVEDLKKARWYLDKLIGVEDNV